MLSTGQLFTLLICFMRKLIERHLEDDLSFECRCDAIPPKITFGFKTSQNFTGTYNRLECEFVSGIWFIRQGIGVLTYKSSEYFDEIVIHEDYTVEYNECEKDIPAYDRGFMKSLYEMLLNVFNGNIDGINTLPMAEIINIEMRNENELEET